MGTVLSTKSCPTLEREGLVRVRSGAGAGALPSPDGTGEGRLASAELLALDAVPGCRGPLP